MQVAIRKFPWGRFYGINDSKHENKQCHLHDEKCINVFVVREIFAYSVVLPEI